MGRLKTFITNNFWLILIVGLFLSTRLYGITKIPASLYWDEASIGYNAYSVLTTGADEWGERFPLHFRAFGEFKLPVYVYSVVASEFVFGATPLAVRLPAVFYGMMAVLALYVLTLKLTKEKSVALLSSFFFVISPWTFIFTRAGYEATAGLSFFLWGIYLYWVSLKNPKFLFLSTLLMVASFYSYNSFRVLVPVSLAIGFIIFLGRLIKEKSWKKIIPLTISLIILGTSLIPLYKLYSQDSGLGRLLTVGVEGENKLVVFGKNYLAHFNPSFLFVRGDINPRSQLPGSPQLYWLDALFIVLGVILILKRRRLGYLSILVALAIAPIPASITKESPHALRSILMAPVFSVITALGVYYFLKLSGKYRRFFLGLILGIYIYLTGAYFYRFIGEYNKLSSDSWQYPYGQIYAQYSTDFADYDTIYITDEFAQPYIFALFYGKVNPHDFIATRTLNPVSDWGFSTVSSFGKFKFIKKCSAEFISNSLIFCSPQDKPYGKVVEIGQILNLKGGTALTVYYHE
jgi:4-amino-4-deoxy-L-arabinose transferase-like glycosyltransferase